MRILLISTLQLIFCCQVYAKELRSKAGKPGYRISKIYRQITRVTLKTCIGECYRESSRCKSFNFNRETYECELSDQSNTDFLQSSSKPWQYIEVELGEFCSKETKTLSRRQSTTPRSTTTKSTLQSTTPKKELPKDATTTTESIKEGESQLDVPQHMTTAISPSTSEINSQAPLSKPIQSSKITLKPTHSEITSTINSLDTSQEMASTMSSATHFSQQENHISTTPFQLLPSPTTLPQLSESTSSLKINAFATTGKATLETTNFALSSLGFATSEAMMTSTIGPEVTHLKTTTEATRISNICLTECAGISYTRIVTTFQFSNGEKMNIHCSCYSTNRLTIFRGSKDLENFPNEKDIQNGYDLKSGHYWIGKENFSRLIKEMVFSKMFIRANEKSEPLCNIVNISSDTDEFQVDPNCKIPSGVPFTFGIWSKCADDTWWWGCGQTKSPPESVFNSDRHEEYLLSLI